MSDVLASIAEVLADAGVTYAVIGEHAVNVWLEPRFTADIDVTVVASPEQLAAVREAFERRGYRLEREYGSEQPSGPDFIRLVNDERTIILELQTAKTALQKDVVLRAAAGGQGVRVATVEDLIVLKLIAFRSKDRADLAGLSALPDIDWTYVERRCAEWDITDRLTTLREK